MLLVKKCQFFLYLDLVKMRLEIILNDFAEKKETFFGYKKQNFSESKKSHFSKGVNPCFWTKNANFFFVYVDLEKIRLKIMLTDFHRKKKNLFDYEKEFFKVQKIRFSKGVGPFFWSKNAIFFPIKIWSK